MTVLDLGMGGKIPSLSPLCFLGKYCALQCGLLPSLLSFSFQAVEVFFFFFSLASVALSLLFLAL